MRARGGGGPVAGDEVLDVGTGAGNVAMIAAELVGPSGTVVGFDNDGAILVVARKPLA